MGRGSGVEERDAVRLGVNSQAPVLRNPASRYIPLLIKPMEVSDADRLTLLTLADLERSDPESGRSGGCPGWDFQEISACGSFAANGVNRAELLKALIGLEKRCLVEAGNLTRTAAIRWTLSPESRRLFFAPDVAEELPGPEVKQGAHHEPHFMYR